MIGGGTGIASLYEIGKRLEGHSDMVFLLGGRTSKDIFDLERFEALGKVQVATDDGSMGSEGFVTQLLKDWLDNSSAESSNKPIYVACGPEPMIEASFKLLRQSVPAEDIWGSVEYMTSCGVGICGKCASPSGLLTCIDGPFLQLEGFERPQRCEAELKA
jgi:dihydroorotate dehydrogenase (NAD+) catalytic subunit